MTGPALRLAITALPTIRMSAFGRRGGLDAGNLRYHVERLYRMDRRLLCGAGRALHASIVFNSFCKTHAPVGRS